MKTFIYNQFLKLNYTIFVSLSLFTNMKAYSEIALIENGITEREIKTKLEKIKETNDSLRIMEEVYSLIDYNFMSIRANIRCGMNTNWKSIMIDILKIQQQVIDPQIKKYLNNMSNLIVYDNNYIDMCFKISQIDTLIELYVKPTISLCEEYETAMKETLDQTRIPEGLVSEILMF